MITIRRALPRDAQTLAALSATTYAQTFNYYPPEDLEHYLSTTYTTENYLTYLADPSTAIWLAEGTDAGTPLGYVMAGPACLPRPDCSDQDGELKRLYVLADQQGSGLGTRLLETALEWLEREHPYRSLWLGSGLKTTAPSASTSATALRALVTTTSRSVPLKTTSSFSEETPDRFHIKSPASLTGKPGCAVLV